MLDSSLLETLRHLTTSELKELDKFVHSRLFFHAKNASGVRALFDLLLPFAPNFDNDDALNHDNIAKQLGQTPQYIVKVTSELHTVVRQYIIWAFQDHKSDAFFEQLALLRFYEKRNLHQRFINLYEKLDKELRSLEKTISLEIQYKRFLLDEFKHIWSYKNKPTSDLHLRQTLDSFEAFTLLKKVQLTYNLLVRNLNSAFDTEGYVFVLEDIEKFCTKNGNEKNGLLLVYYEAILLIIEREDADFDLFQKLLAENSHLLDLEDYHSLHGFERQFLNIRYTKGQSELLPRIFKVYQSHLAKGLLESSGYLPPFTFTNIVRHACRLGELVWVEDFLEKYQYKLGGTANPKDLFRLYFAYFLIHKRQFDKAEAYLSADFDDPITKVDARCFELMLMYETESDLIDYKIESFRKLVRNTIGLPEVRRKGFHNFALTLRKMINPDLKYNDKRIEKIITEINTAPTSESIWLGQKLGKLKRKK